MKNALQINSKHKLFSGRFALIILCILFSAFTKNGSVFSQGWQWANGAGDIGFDNGRPTCTDAMGNVYVGGYFASASIQIGTVTLVNSGSGDVFVAKYDANGNFLWAQKIGGSGSESIGGICTDPSGNVYVTGYFGSSFISIPPLTMTCIAGAPEVYVGCFNASGVPQWFNNYGGTGDQRGSSCAYSSSLSCLYVTGYYYTTQMAIGATTLNNTSSTGKCDLFLARFTSAGVPVWARTTGGVGADDIPSEVSVDAAGLPHIGGIYSPTLITGPTVIGTTTLTSYGTQDFFTAKYDASGTFQWARGAGSSGGGDYYGGLKVDGLGNVCFTGYYHTSPLIIGNLTLTPSGSNYDGFVAKYNSAGTIQWANKVAGAGDDYMNAIALDANNNIYITGCFSGTTIAIGATTLTNTNPGSVDVIAAKYNNAGVQQWATKANGTTDEWGYGIASDAAGNVYVAGSVNTSGATFGTYTVASNGGSDMFLAKIGCVTPTISGLSTICNGTSATLTAGGATTYTWNTGATGSSIVVSPTVATTYSVIGGAGNCQAPGLTNFSLNVLPANVNPGPALNLLCGQKQLISASATPANPINVSWSPTLGLTSGTVLTPSVTAMSPSTNYTITVTLSNSCQATAVLLVTQYAPAPSICMVTVDSIGKNNLILWDKTASPKADTFYVYRDIANNNYQLIGRVPKSAPFGEFQDTVRTLFAANGDPNVSAWRYKISYKDSCGNVSPKSMFHKTIFMQHNNNNFNWNDYQIEGQSIPVPVLNNYIFRRDDLATGNWQNIQTLSSVSTGYTDPNYTTYSVTADWRAETVWAVQCNSSYLKTMAGAVKRSKSNVSNNRTINIGMKENNLEKYVSIYPNPASSLLNVDFKAANENYEITIENAIGQTVYQSKNNEGISGIDVSHLASGFYTLKVQTAGAGLNKKIIIE